MTFEAFYNGAVHHPLQLWVAALLATAYAVSRHDLDPTLRRFCAGLGLLSIADAWLTSSTPYGVGSLTGWAASLVPLSFVLLGDLRYLLLVFAATPDGRLCFTARNVAGAAGLTLLVPIASQLATSALPAPYGGPRTLYLIYELCFFALAALLANRHPGPASAPWLRRLSGFVMLYYGLWATADLVILTTGSDLGFALRLVPNLLYYGGLIAAIAWFAPRVPTLKPRVGPGTHTPPSRRPHDPERPTDHPV